MENPSRAAAAGGCVTVSPVGVAATPRVAHCAAGVGIGPVEEALPVVVAAVAQPAAATVPVIAKTYVVAGIVLCSAPLVPQPVVQSRRRPLLGPSPD